MATKKPWRTVITGTSTGRFTREQIRDAIDSVSSTSNVSGTKSKGDGGASKSRTESDPSRESGTVTSRAAKGGGTVRRRSAGGAKGESTRSSARKVAPKTGGAAASKNGKPAKPRKGTPD